MVLLNNTHYIYIYIYIYSWDYGSVRIPNSPKRLRCTFIWGVFKLQKYTTCQRTNYHDATNIEYRSKSIRWDQQIGLLPSQLRQIYPAMPKSTACLQYIYIYIYIYIYKIFFNPINPLRGKIPSGQINYSNFEYLNIPG